MCKPGESNTVLNAPLSRPGKSLTHRTALLAALIISFLPSSGHRQSTHTLLHYPVVAMTLSGSWQRPFALLNTDQEHPQPWGTEAAQTRAPGEAPSFGPRGERQAKGAAQILEQAANTTFNPSFVQGWEKALALESTAGRLQLVPLTPRCWCTEQAALAQDRIQATHSWGDQINKPALS